MDSERNEQLELDQVLDEIALSWWFEVTNHWREQEVRSLVEQLTAGRTSDGKEAKGDIYEQQRNGEDE